VGLLRAVINCAFVLFAA